MYKTLVRPLLFLIPAETVHHAIAAGIRILYRVPGVPALFRHLFKPGIEVETVDIAGLKFRGRVGLAAGFDKNATLFNEFASFGFSHIEVGTVTPLPQPGNPRPRLFRLPKDKALINRMGFNNLGVHSMSHNLAKRKAHIVIGGNIGKNTLTPNESAEDDFASCLEVLYPHVDYIAVNISCPNINGMEKLQEQDSLRKILVRTMAYRNIQPLFKPVFLKISPDLPDDQVDEAISMCLEYGVNGIIASNTTKKRAKLITQSGRLEQIGPGGLSGAPLRQHTLERISYICKQSDGRLPVIAVGGIMNELDAVKAIRSGATLIQMYTGFIYEGPFIVKKINRALHKELAGQSADLSKTESNQLHT